MRLKELIALHSNDALAKEPGMVYQVWEDGEITLQKSGSLLWQQSLHCIEPGYATRAVQIDLFPHQSGNHGYAFVSEDGAQIIRTEILKSPAPDVSP